MDELVLLKPEASETDRSPGLLRYPYQTGYR